MNHYLIKSEINLSAAQFLHRHTYFLPVIHCAYYSCFQYMKHISDNEPLIFININVEKFGSHIDLIKKIKKILKKKRLNFRSFYKLFQRGYSTYSTGS